MRIVFKFHYIHDNGLFARLLDRIREVSVLPIRLYQEKMDYIIEASAEQNELETLAEIVSSLVPQSLFLSEHSIEAVDESLEFQDLVQESCRYKIPYCPECQDKIMKTLNPFITCNVCGFSDVKLSFDELRESAKSETDTAKELFEELAQQLIETGTLSLPTYNGIRNFARLSDQEHDGRGILICDPSEISASFVITQDELTTLMMIEKPSVRLKPKLKFRAMNDLVKPFYPVFFADDKVTLALSLALSRKEVFALYCDNITSLRAASALEEHVIIQTGRDMLPWKHAMTLDQVASCKFDGFTAFSDQNGLFLNRGFEPTEPCVKFVSKEDPSSGENSIGFQTSHAALRSVVLEHDLQGKSLCGIYLSRHHNSAICSFSSKVGYTSLVDFSYDIVDDPVSMIESISQMDDEGTRLIANYKKAYPKLHEQIEKSKFHPDKNASMLSRLWAMAAVVIGLVEGGDVQSACEELEATALEFNGKSGPRIDYKVLKSERGYELDPRRAIRSAISFKLAGVDEYLLSFGFIDSLADFLAEQAELADANIGIEGVSLNGSLFENRQLLMRTYNALSPNYKIYRNKRLAVDGANVAVGAITLGSE